MPETFRFGYFCLWTWGTLSREVAYLSAQMPARRQARALFIAHNVQLAFLPECVARESNELQLSPYLSAYINSVPT